MLAQVGTDKKYPKVLREILGENGKRLLKPGEGENHKEIFLEVFGKEKSKLGLMNSLFLRTSKSYKNVKSTGSLRSSVEQ